MLSRSVSLHIPDSNILDWCSTPTIHHIPSPDVPSPGQTCNKEWDLQFIDTYHIHRTYHSSLHHKTPCAKTPILNTRSTSLRTKNQEPRTKNHLTTTSPQQATQCYKNDLPLSHIFPKVMPPLPTIYLILPISHTEYSQWQDLSSAKPNFQKLKISDMPNLFLQKKRRLQGHHRHGNFRW